MTGAEPRQIEEPSTRVVVTPSWLEGARRYAARKHGPVAHHDGTCDALFPGAALDRDGRCLLPEGHAGTHVYRGRGPARKPTRERAYQAERDEKKRLARLALHRQRLRWAAHRERSTL